MATSDPRIHPTTVTFTPTSAYVGDSNVASNTAYIKVQVLPTGNGKDIESVQIWYFNPDAVPSRLNEKLSETNIFRQLIFNIKGSKSTLVDKAAEYMHALSSDEIAIIVKEYTKYVDSNGVLIDVFIAGIGAYLGFLLLNENGAFTNQMPFQFGVLHPVRSGMTLTRNMFEYLSLPLTALIRSGQGILLQLVLFIQSFINLWEPLFLDGPILNTNHTARMALEVISGLAQHVTTTLVRTQELNAAISRQLSSVETRLQSYVDDALVKLRREFNNLVAESRGAIKELNSASEVHRLNESIKEKVAQITDSHLINQIHPLIKIEVAASQNYIDELIRAHDERTSSSLNELRTILEHQQVIIQGLEAIEDIESQDGQRSNRYDNLSNNDAADEYLPPSPPTEPNDQCEESINEDISHWIQPETRSHEYIDTGGPIAGKDFNNSFLRSSIVAPEPDRIRINAEISPSSKPAQRQDRSLVAWNRTKWCGTH